MTDAARQLVRCCEQEDAPGSLMQAALIVAAQEYPGLDSAPLLAELQHLAERARAAALADGGPEQPAAMAAALRQVLAVEEGFTGSREDYYDPRNSFVNEVLARRRGLPITLCIVAMHVASLAGARAHGIGLPGHFVMRLGEGSQSVFLDPYHDFRELDREACVVLGCAHLPDPELWRDDYLVPVTVPEIIGRVLTNLKGASVRRKELARALWVQDLRVALEPTSAPELRDRGLLHARHHHYEQARRDLQRYLEMCVTPPPDAEHIERQLARIRLLARMMN